MTKPAKKPEIRNTAFGYEARVGGRTYTAWTKAGLEAKLKAAKKAKAKGFDSNRKWWML